jgi:hypothetical protein
MSVFGYNLGKLNTSGSAANRPLNTKADKELMMSTSNYTSKSDKKQNNICECCKQERGIRQSFYGWKLCHDCFDFLTQFTSGSMPHDKGIPLRVPEAKIYLNMNDQTWLMFDELDSSRCVYGVYFLQMGSSSMVKIGITRGSVQTRINGIANANPFTLKLIGFIPANRAMPLKSMERRLHQRFWYLRRVREWFELDEVLSDYIQTKCQPTLDEKTKVRSNIELDLSSWGFD